MAAVLDVGVVASKGFWCAPPHACLTAISMTEKQEDQENINVDSNDSPQACNVGEKLLSEMDALKSTTHAITSEICTP